jgi:hypothetical protein
MCNRRNKMEKDYSKIKTVISCPTGYYGSEYLWNDPVYAFKKMNDDMRVFHPYGTYYNKNQNANKWEYLGKDKETTALKINVNADVLPEWDYDFCILQ